MLALNFLPYLHVITHFFIKYFFAMCTIPFITCQIHGGKQGCVSCVWGIYSLAGRWTSLKAMDGPWDEARMRMGARWTSMESVSLGRWLGPERPCELSAVGLVKSQRKNVPIVCAQTQHGLE